MITSQSAGFVVVDARGLYRIESLFADVEYVQDGATLLISRDDYIMFLFQPAFEELPTLDEYRARKTLRQVRHTR